MGISRDFGEVVVTFGRDGRVSEQKIGTCLIVGPQAELVDRSRGVP